MKRTLQFRVVIVLACLCILVIAAVSVIGPSGSTEASNVGTPLTANTRLPNFDIRTSVSDEDSAFRASVRETEQDPIVSGERSNLTGRNGPRRLSTVAKDRAQ